jgi:hypothetical protein
MTKRRKDAYKGTCCACKYIEPDDTLAIGGVDNRRCQRDFESINLVGDGKMEGVSLNVYEAFDMAASW